MEINQAKLSLATLVLIMPLISSCTVNITLAHTQGWANDLVDETATTDTDAEADVPLKGI